MGYDLDQFFRVKTEVSLPGGQKCYLRCLSDWETRQRAEASLLASTRRRQELRDPQSEAYRAYVEPIEYATEENLRNTILALEQRNIARDVLDEIELPYIAFPDGASLQERQEVVLKREEAEKATARDREKAIKARVNQLKKTLEKKNKSYLVSRCQAVQESAQSLVTYVMEFNRQTLLYCCFKDEGRTQRFFADAEQVTELPSAIYDHLLAEYTTIDRAQARQLQDFFQERDSAVNRKGN